MGQFGNMDYIYACMCYSYMTSWARVWGIRELISHFSSSPPHSVGANFTLIVFEHGDIFDVVYVSPFAKNGSTAR